MYDENVEFFIVDDDCCSLLLLSLRIITVLLCVGEFKDGFGDEHRSDDVADLTGLRRTIVGSAINRSRVEELKKRDMNIRYNAKRKIYCI
jgi:hypothetical protein